MTRDEYLQWCKDRALEYLDKGDIQNALASMLSDLGKHDELAPVSKSLGPLGIMYAIQQDHDGMRKFITGSR